MLWCECSKLYFKFIPEWVTNGLSIAAGMLPVVGIGMLMRYMPVKKFLPFILIGFVLSAYLNVPVLGIAIVGFAAAFWYFTTELRKSDATEAVTVASKYSNSKRWEMISMSNEMNTVNQKNTQTPVEQTADGRYKVTKRDLRRTAARYNFMACNIFNYESQMGPAVAWAMAPVLRKIYKDDEEYKAALK